MDCYARHGLKKVCAGNVWLRRLRKSLESLYLRKHKAISLTRSATLHRKNLKAFFENLKELMSRTQFHSY